MKRPPKLTSILHNVAESVAKGSILYSKHASERMLERGIIKPEVEHVLVHGHHEARKDQFNADHFAWDYAIKGKTIDGRNLRIVIALIEPNVFVITAIDLDQ